MKLDHQVNEKTSLLYDDKTSVVIGCDLGDYKSALDPDFVVLVVEETELEDSIDSSSIDDSSCYHKLYSGQLNLRYYCWEYYVTLVDDQPVLVKAVTATLLFILADLMAQMIEYERTKIDCFDAMRTIRFASFGLMGAPWSHYYFLWLDTLLPPTQNPWTVRTALKVTIDQFLQAPLLLALMITSLSLMEGRGIDGVESDLSENFVKTLIANWKLWVPASVINLGLVKPSLRVLYVNLVFMVWTIILSMMLSDSI